MKEIIKKITEASVKAVELLKEEKTDEAITQLESVADITEEATKKADEIETKNVELETENSELQKFALEQKSVIEKLEKEQIEKTDLKTEVTKLEERIKKLEEAKGTSKQLEEEPKEKSVWE